MLSTIHFHLILSTVFLTFKYSTVFISLLGTIYFNLIVFYLPGSKHSVNVQTVYLQCFKSLTIITILIKNKTDSFFVCFLNCA